MSNRGKGRCQNIHNSKRRQQEQTKEDSDNLATKKEKDQHLHKHRILKICVKQQRKKIIPYLICWHQFIRTARWPHSLCPIAHQRQWREWIVYHRCTHGGVEAHRKGNADDGGDATRAGGLIRCGWCGDAFLLMC